MNEEILKFKGRLAELELDCKRLEISSKGLINSLRGLLDPHEMLEGLSPEMITDQALRLSDLLTQYREKQEIMRAVKKSLGR